MSMGTISATPAQDALWRAWIWLQTHRKTRFALIVAAVCTVCSLMNVTLAMADDGQKSQGSFGTYFLPLDEVTDSHGVHLDKYTELPLDYGQGTYIHRIIRGAFMRLAWTIYTVVVYLVLAMAKFILDMTWVDWLLSPLILLSNAVHQILSQIGLLGLGIAVSALVIGWAVVRGRTGAAFVEAALVAVVIGVAATPIAQPASHIKDWVTVSSSYGKEAGTATVSASNKGQDVAKDPVSGQLVDLTVRRPALILSFGSDLNGDKCAQTFDDEGKKGTDAEGIRKAVLRCNDGLKGANETDSAVIFAFLFMFWVSTGGLLTVVGVFIVFIIKDVLLAGLGSVNVVLRAHLAVFPGSARKAFVNAVLQVLVNVVLVGGYIWLLSVYLWLIKVITGAVGEANMMISSGIIGLLLMVMAAVFWKMKKNGKSLARAIANRLGGGGLASQKELAPSRFSQAGQQMLKTGGNAAKRAMRNRANQAMATKTAAAAAGVATGGTATAAATAVEATRMAAAGWFLAGHMMPNQRPQRQPAAQQNYRKDMDEQGSLPAHPAAADVENVRDENGAVPMDPQPEGQNAPTEAEKASSPTDTHAPEQGPGSGAGATVPTPSGSADTPVDQSAPERNGSHAAGTEQTGPQGSGADAEAPQGRRKGSRLPAGRYGGVWVNKDGSTNRVLQGEVVDTVPARAKVVPAWDVSEHPAESKPRRTRGSATESGTYQEAMARRSQAGDR